jgi:uncharacterized membrane protein YhaH (DUF805 family)
MTDPQHRAGAAAQSGMFWWLHGRGGRREYWTHVAMLLAVSFVMSNAAPVLGIVLNLMLMFVQIRRIHDMGRSGWWAVAATVIPIVLILPVMMVSSLDLATITGVIFELMLILAIGVPPGDADENRFGPPPPYTARRVLTGR